MSTEQLWLALIDLAAEWRRTPRITSLNETAPYPYMPVDPIPRYLQGKQAGASMLFGHPLALASSVQYASGLPSFGQEDLDADQMERLMSAAAPAEEAHRLTVAWVRSRIPGYPHLYMPQLARGSALTTPEYSNRYTRRQHDIAAGMQYQATPPYLGQLLQDDDRNVAKKSFALADAFKSTPEWVAYAATERELSPQDREDLRLARRALAETLKPDKVDAHEPQLVFPRLQYREHHTEEILNTLAGAAAAFAQAFKSLNDHVDRHLVDAFAQLVRAGAPRTYTPTDVTVEGGPAANVTADLPENGIDPYPPIFINAGDLVRVNHPGVPDLVFVMGKSLSWNQVESSVRISGPQLAGSRHVLDVICRLG